jgi:hypothetical protein
MSVSTLPLAARDGVVPLPAVAASAGVSLNVLQKAVTEGLIDPAPVRRRHNTRTLTAEDAAFILAVAALAALAGVAFVSMLRTMRHTGASLTTAGIVVPVPK